MELEVIGERIKKARKALGMTRKKFAGGIRIGDRGTGGMMENASENKKNKEMIQEARIMVMEAAKMLEVAREKVYEFEETAEDANEKVKSYTCYEDLLCVNRDLSIISDRLERI